MKKRILVVLLLLALISSGTALFANGQQEPAEEQAGDGTTTITWWALSGGGGADDPRENARLEMIKEFEAAHPGVHVDLVMLENEAFKQKIQVAIQAGDPPDLFHSWGGGVMAEYAAAGMLKDITPAVENELSKTIGLGALGVYSVLGQYYGAPYDMGAVGMWYNKDIFEAAGVEVPTTWAELLSIIPKIKEAGYIPISVGAGDKWPAMYWWVYLAMRCGGQDAFNKAYSGSGSFADAPYVKAGELLNELIALEPFQTGFLGSSYDDEASLMGNGKAAMELMGQWAPAVEVANSVSGTGIGDSLGWFAFPAVAGGAGAATDVMGGGGGYVLGKDAPEETVELLKFFLTKENNMKMVEVEGSVPVVAGADEAVKGNPNMVKMIDTIASAGYYQLYYDQILPPAVGAAVNDAVASLFAGMSTPEECAQSIQDAWEASK
ncbi:MAG: extracellular solute-binding protein [Spirochaetales bacterium]|nr:extracellular solute-binding protein [Spirochaetales bacterium]